MTLQDNYRNICSIVERTVSENGIGQSVTVVAVTKSQPKEIIPELVSLGVTDFAENRVSMLEERAPLMLGTRHLIGHLQTHKVKKALLCSDLIQSVDSFHLAREIDRQSGIMGTRSDVLLQVNIAKEPQKFGLDVADVRPLLSDISLMEYVNVRGLMAIMPIETKEIYYQEMYDLFRNLQQTAPQGVSMEILSMGMSNDYPLAVKHGANMIRVGRCLYI